MILSDTTILDRRSRRDLKRTIFLGTRDGPGLRDGQLSLTQKGGEIRFGAATEFVCSVPDATIAQWRTALGIGADPARPFAGQVIEIEDASPDSCLALLALARRLAGDSLPAAWLDYARQWELGNVHSTGPAEHSFGALQSALVHPEFNGLPDEAAAMARALAIGVGYTEGLLALGIEPGNVPDVLKAPVDSPLLELHGRARAYLAFERMVYRRLLADAARLQLAVPLRGSARRVLVDALIFSEVELTGALKVFARTDHDSPSGNGYGLLALYRPGEAMNGNDMTVSVDPTIPLTLDALWRELERREEDAWTAFAATPKGYPRPRGPKARVTMSHRRPDPPTKPSDQPWWDDDGNATLVAAPRGVDVGGTRVPGTRLGWEDVKAALWACYAPSLGVRVRQRGSTDAGCSLTNLAQGLSTPLAPDSGLLLADLERVDAHDDEVVLWSPTLTATCAAAIDGALIRLDSLPAPDSYDAVEGRGGMVVVAEQGVMLLALTADGSFPAAELKRAASDVAATVACTRRIEDLRRAQGSGIRDLVRKAVESGSDSYKRDALRAIYAAKIEAREAWDAAQRVETDALVRRLRALCEARWGARERLDRAIAEIEELEDMVVSSSDVRASGLLNKIAIFGLPASVLGNLLGSLLILKDGDYQGVSVATLVTYGGLCAIGVLFLLLLSRMSARGWRIKR